MSRNPNSIAKEIARELRSGNKLKKSFITLPVTIQPKVWHLLRRYAWEAVKASPTTPGVMEVWGWIQETENEIEEKRIAYRDRHKNDPSLPCNECGGDKQTGHQGLCETAMAAAGYMLDKKNNWVKPKGWKKCAKAVGRRGTKKFYLRYHCLSCGAEPNQPCKKTCRPKGTA